MHKNNFDKIVARLQEFKNTAPRHVAPELVQGVRETIDFLSADMNRMAAVVGIAGVVVAYNPDALDDIIHLSMLLAREEEKKAA
jgi:hypothetical protein